jgi:hypothetical protein
MSGATTISIEKSTAQRKSTGLMAILLERGKRIDYVQ